MVGVTFVWTVGFFFSELLQCVPISANWKGFGYDPAACGVNANIMIMAQTWSDIATNGKDTSSASCVRLILIALQW